MMKQSPISSFSFICILIFFIGQFPFSLSAQEWDTLAPIPESFTFPVVASVNGKIHIMGGGGSGGATSLHYAYDPTTDTWESKANIPYMSQQPAGAAANGKIHFFGGGFPNSGSPVDDHYIYDPEMDSWEQAASLTAPRAIHYAVGLDGLIYSMAGQGMSNLCQTYDQNTDSWTTKNNLPDTHFWYGAHVATQGNIYRFCGGPYIAPKDFAHVYDPFTDSWASLPDFPVANHGLRAAAIGSQIWITGGYYDFQERADVWVFDTQTNAYSTGPSLPLGRNYHTMATVDSCIYVLGGNHAIDETVRTQLLRLCPYDDISSTKDLHQIQSMDASYFSGKIIMQMPDGLSGISEVYLFDLAGRNLFSEKIINSQNVYEIWTGNLPPSFYFLQLRTGDTIYSSKIIVQ